MTEKRLFSKNVYSQLKASFKELVKKAGGQQAAGSLTRVDHQRISQYALPHIETQPPIEAISSG